MSDQSAWSVLFFRSPGHSEVKEKLAARTETKRRNSCRHYEASLCGVLDSRTEADPSAPKVPGTIVEGEGPIRKETYATGDWYYGQFKGAVREGKGRYVYAEGNVLEFEGDFKDGLGDGLGVFRYGSHPPSSLFSCSRSELNSHTITHHLLATYPIPLAECRLAPTLVFRTVPLAVPHHSTQNLELRALSRGSLPTAPHYQNVSYHASKRFTPSTNSPRTVQPPTTRHVRFRRARRAQIVNQTSPTPPSLSTALGLPTQPRGGVGA
eukprot:1184173-Prorocentrum_minimum.AAC.1